MAEKREILNLLRELTRKIEQAELRDGAPHERLQLLIDSVVDYAIFTITHDGRVASWGRGGERTFGYRADEIVGMDVAILFTPEDRDAGVPEEELRRAALEGRACDERYQLRKDGRRFYSSGVTTRLGVRNELGFAKIARDLTAQRESEIALERAYAELEDRVAQRTRELQLEVLHHANAQADVRNLLRKLVSAQESERARIARDLHDQLGQQLTALRLTLERYREKLKSPDDTGDVDRALSLARAIDQDLDFLAWELRPTALDDLGLAAALPRFVRTWAEHFGIAAEYRAAGFVAGQLRHEAEVAFYRIAQEALNNVVKHAHASRVDVILETREGAVMLVVEDDGVGFDAAGRDVREQGIGLAGMNERALLAGGTLHVESTPGKGTTVYLRCPVATAEQTESVG